MEITLNREDFFSGIKIVEKITAQKANQAILSNVLIEANSSDRIKFCATDLNFAISYKTKAEVTSEGAVVLSAKVISDIVSKLSSSQISLKTVEDTDNVKIKAAKTEFDLIGLNPAEFPKVLEGKDDETFKTVIINKNEFSRAIKQVIFAVSIQETQAALTGVCFNIEGKNLEMASTDGNRLTRFKKELEDEIEDNLNFIVPSKTLTEVQRISSIVEDENITLKIFKNKIIFEFKDLTFQSRLIDSVYPKYQQLIPEMNDKIIVADRVELINAIERASVFANNRTNDVKFNLSSNQMEIMANSPELGKFKDYIDVEYNNEDILIAFNYKYVLDALKNMDTKNIEIKIANVLSASVFKPQEDNNSYICVIMPIKVQ